MCTLAHVKRGGSIVCAHFALVAAANSSRASQHSRVCATRICPCSLFAKRPATVTPRWYAVHTCALGMCGFHPYLHATTHYVLLPRGVLSLPDVTPDTCAQDKRGSTRLRTSCTVRSSAKASRYRRKMRLAWRTSTTWSCGGRGSAFLSKSVIV